MQTHKQLLSNSYLNKIVSQTDDNRHSKQFWSFIKSRKCENLQLSTLNDHTGWSVSDDKVKAAILNKRFTSFVFTQDGREVPQINWIYPSMHAFENMEARVDKLLRNLNEHKAAGPDAITPDKLWGLTQ